MTDFVLEILDNDVTVSYGIRDKVVEIRNYAKFLKQPLTLGMFIPCDLEGNVLVEPSFSGVVEDEQYYGAEMDVYQEAKERVLFEDSEIKNEIFIHDIKHYYLVVNNKKIAWNYNDEWVFYKENNTIEDLITYNFTLTPNALTKLMK